MSIIIQLGKISLLGIWLFSTAYILVQKGGESAFLFGSLTLIGLMIVAGIETELEIYLTKNTYNYRR